MKLSKLRQMIREEILKEYYEVEYYDIQGGHGGIGNWPSFDVAYKKAIDLYKREKKDGHLGTSTGYIGVSGDGDKFAIIYITTDYLKNTSINDFKNKISYQKWVWQAKKALQTGKPMKGVYEDEKI